MEEKTLYLSLALEGKEIETFEQAKEKSGIKSNSELLRFLIKNYASK